MRNFLLVGQVGDLSRFFFMILKCTFLLGKKVDLLPQSGPFYAENGTFSLKLTYIRLYIDNVLFVAEACRSKWKQSEPATQILELAKKNTIVDVACQTD